MPALIDEPGYEDLLWQVIDQAAVFNVGQAGGWSLPPADQFRTLAKASVPRFSTGLSAAESADIVQACTDEIYAYGPLTPLMAMQDITDILVNGPSEIFVDRGRGLERANVRFLSGEHLWAFAQRHLGRAGKTINRSNPVADADLADGSRLHVIGPPVSGQFVRLSIRRFRTAMTLDELARSGGLSASDTRKLRDIVAQRRNVLIAGGPGAGKTTLMGALLSEVLPSDRIVGIEDVPELRPSHPQYVRLLTRQGGGAYQAQTSARDLVREALRMRPDRLVVGEVRGPEALDMVSAMTTGMDGSMTTIHASSASGALERLGVLLAMASGSDQAMRLANQAIDTIVFVRRHTDGRRVIEAIENVV
jgi:pilus assembly protein CpaF